MSTKEEQKERMKEWRKNNAEKVKSYKKKWRENNPEKARIAGNSWRNKNREKVAARQKKRESINPEKHKLRKRVNESNRRARKRKAEGKYTLEDVRKIYDRQKGFCVTCETSLLKGYHVDHVFPLAKGGSNNAQNLQLLCPSCNMQKHDLIFEVFIRRKILGV